MSADETTTGTGLAFEGSWAYDSPEAGTVVLSGKTVCPQGIGLTTHGIALGPVELSAYTDSTVKIKDLRYGAKESSFFDDWGSDNSTDFFGAALGFGGIAAAGHEADEADKGISRREVLASTGLAILGTASVSRAVSAQSGTQVSVARFELPSNPGGVSVRLRDLAENYLPTDALYYVLIDGMDYAEFRGGSNQSGDIPPIPDGETRSVEITTDAEGLLAGIKAKLGRKELEYSFTLPVPPGDAGTGERLVVTDHPMIREAALRASSGALTLSIGDESIPHEAEDREDSIGWYGIRDGNIVYHVGSQPPSSTTAEFVVYAGVLEEVLDDSGRVIS